MIKSVLNLPTFIFMFIGRMNIYVWNFSRPKRIYAFGPFTIQSIENILVGIRYYPFVYGYDLCRSWHDLEIVSEKYDFTVIYLAIIRLE